MKTIISILLFIPVVSFSQDSTNSFLNPRSSINFFPLALLGSSNTVLFSFQYRIGPRFALEHQVGYIFDRMDITDNETEHQKIDSRKLNYQIKTDLVFFFKGDDNKLNGQYIGLLLFFRQVHLTNFHDLFLDCKYDTSSDSYDCNNVHNPYLITRNEYGILVKMGYLITPYMPFANFYCDIFCDIGSKYITTQTKSKIRGNIIDPDYDIDPGTDHFNDPIFAFDESFNGWGFAMYLGIKVGYYFN